MIRSLTRTKIDETSIRDNLKPELTIFGDNALAFIIFLFA